MRWRGYASDLPPEWEAFVANWYNERPVTHLTGADLFLVRRDASVRYWPTGMLPRGWGISEMGRARTVVENERSRRPTYAIVG